MISAKEAKGQSISHKIKISENVKKFIETAILEGNFQVKVYKDSLSGGDIKLLKDLGYAIHEVSKEVVSISWL